MKDKLIFGDLQGEYEAMMRIIDKAPKDVEYISCGDMIDRGPDSKKVLDFFMENGRAVKGNHEHMMVDAYLNTFFYDDGLWEMNGGGDTMRSFGYKSVGTLPDGKLPDWRVKVPEKYIMWLASLPLYIQEGDDEDGDVFISHAPLNPVLGVERACELGSGFRFPNCDSKTPESLLWNRGKPRHNDEFFQVHGHMSHHNVVWYENLEEVWGVNVDTNRGGKVSAVLWPSLEIYEQEYRK